jgi:hypothetical protein
LIGLFGQACASANAGARHKTAIAHAIFVGKLFMLLSFVGKPRSGSITA